MNAALGSRRTGLKATLATARFNDLIAGRTGGTAPGLGGRGTVQERVSVPGYQKDVMGWYEDWLQEAKNKVATGPSMVGQVLTNRNWKGDPIINPESSAPEWLKQYFQYVTESLGPITLRQLAKGQKTGSNIGAVEGMMGLRPAPAYLQDPEGMAKFKKYQHTRDWQKKQRYEKRQQNQYGGPTE